MSHTMYNEFLREIFRHRDSGLLRTDVNLLIVGYRDYQMNSTWNLNKFPVDDALANDLRLNHINDMENKLPQNVIDIFGTKEDEEPYVYIPKNKINSAGYEVFEKGYERPYNLEQILRVYGKQTAEMLTADKVHSWRAITGIELTHQEPTIAEQERTFKNWQKMGYYSKNLSDHRSMMLFGIDNAEHYKLIMDKEKELPSPKYTPTEMNIRKNMYRFIEDFING